MLIQAAGSLTQPTDIAIFYQSQAKISWIANQMAGAAIPSLGVGHNKDPFDPRDHYYTPDPGTQPPKSVNLRQDYAQLTSEI